MAISVNVPVATNQVSADLTAMAANMKYIVCGDGTAGRVLRLSKITITDGTATASIKVKMDSIWNGDNIAEVDNIKGDDVPVGVFTMTGYSIPIPDDSNRLFIDSSAFAGNIIACLGITTFQNSISDFGEGLDVSAKVISNDMVISFRDIEFGTYASLTGNMSGSETLIFYITYLTSA